MAKYRMVGTDFWKDPVVLEEMTPEDRYFYLYLLTNPRTTQIGIYKITKKEMAFDLGYSIESVHSLMDRFIHHHQLIRYNPETRELAIKNWGKTNLRKGGKPVMDCILSELKDVEDASLISYVAEQVGKGDILTLYQSFYEMEEENILHANTYINVEESLVEVSCNDTPATRSTIRGQKEKEKQKENKKQQQNLYPTIDDVPNGDHLNQHDQDVKEIIQFWDQNGFGFSNLNAKQQLLWWLSDSRFLQPKEVILKAMQLACSTNKRRLNYVEGILKNWENESLLTIDEIELEIENLNQAKLKRRSVQKEYSGRDIPTNFVLDITAGEE